MSKQLKMYKISLTMLLLLVCSSSAQAANAEKKPGFAKQKYYSFYDDGGEHQVDSCELANKLPKSSLKNC